MFAEASLPVAADRGHDMSKAKEVNEMSGFQGESGPVLWVLDQERSVEIKNGFIVYQYSSQNEKC